MTEIICAIIAALATIVVAVLEVRNRRERGKAEERYAIRSEESRLSMELMSAQCKLSLVTAKAVLNMKTNGDVEEAFEAVKEAQTKYDEYIRKLAAMKACKI
jgi:hypothetical protein